MVPRRVEGEVGLGEPQEGVGRSKAVLLKVDECAGELDEALVEARVRAAAFREPERFEDFVGFEVIAAVEAGEPAGVMGIEAVGVFDAQLGNAVGL